MNIFATSPCPIESAQALCDKHVVKMIVESAQILSTALVTAWGFPSGGSIRGVDLYRPTHAAHPCVVWAHPCVVWVGKSWANMYWIARHGVALCTEYSARYSTDKVFKRHKSLDLLLAILGFIESDVGVSADSVLTPMALAMPDHFKRDDPHMAYKLYLRAKYQTWADEGHPPRWTKREPPIWARSIYSALDNSMASG